RRGPRCAPPWAADKSPIGLPKRWSAFPRRPFFECWPPLGLPGSNRVLVALRGSLDRLLHAQTHRTEEPTDMGGMIAHPEGPPDDLRHPLGCPHLAAIAIRFGSWR